MRNKKPMSPLPAHFLQPNLPRPLNHPELARSVQQPGAQRDCVGMLVKRETLYIFIYIPYNCFFHIAMTLLDQYWETRW